MILISGIEESVHLMRIKETLELNRNSIEHGRKRSSGSFKPLVERSSNQIRRSRQNSSDEGHIIYSSGKENTDDISKMRKQILVLEREKRNLEKACLEARSHVARKDDTLKALRKAVGKLTDKNAKICVEIGELKDKRSKEGAEESSSKLEEAHKEYDTLLVEYEALKQRYKCLDEEMASIASEVISDQRNMDKIIEELKESNEKLQRQISIETHKNSLIGKEVERLKNCESESYRLAGMTTHLERSLEKAEADIERLRESNKALELELALSKHNRL